MECQTEDWKVHRHMCKEAEPAKDKLIENPAITGEKSVSLDTADSSSIQRVYMKDLHSKVITGTELQAAVVEFQTPGRFFIVAQSAEILEALQIITAELQTTYVFPTASAHKPVVDEVCAVQYSCDMNWYRGLVQKLDADQAHILYIDFGNEENVPFERIRPLAAKLQEFGPCAIECCISGVVPAAKTWSVKCCIATRQLLEGKTMTVKVFETLDNGSTHAVEIVLSKGNTVSSFLLEHEYALKDVVNKTPSEQDIKAMVDASLENFRRCSVGKDDNSWATVPETLTQAVGDSFSVVATHIQSPEKIVVQKVDNAAIIQELQMNLREHCSQVSASSLFRPAPGTVCCASFSEDKQWYRAKVLAYSSEERVCVGYLDFGNSEEVDLNNLRPISQSLLATPMQAMTCGLAGVQPVGETWSEESLHALQRRISNRILRIEIQGSHEGNVLVTLIDEASDPQANIAELLMFAGFAAPAVKKNSDDQPSEMTPPAPEVPVSRPKAEPLVWSCAELSPEGQMVLLRVCCVESPGKFFCHVINSADNQRLIELEAELKPHCEVVASSFEPKLGEPCCAIITETGGKCFRALIKQLCDDEVSVALVDYGHCMTVKKSDLRPITSKYLELPFQALPCWLAGVMPEGSEWTAQALLWFQTLVEGEALSAQVVSVTEDGYGVELQSKGQSVAAALVMEHLAKYPGQEEKKQETASVSDTKHNENVPGIRQEQPQGPTEQQRSLSDTAPSPAEESSFRVDWKTAVLPLNEPFKPCIAAMSNPSLFYLFGPRQVGEEQIQEMMLQLAEHCNCQVFRPPLSDCVQPRTGAACCARFTADNNWYRAVVLEVYDQEANVVYADYGNSEKLSLSNILPIPARFLQLPFQITRCSIVDKELTPAEWPGEVLQMFLGALQHGVLATVQSFDGFSNILTLSLSTESTGEQVSVNAMILGALQALSQTTAGPGSGEMPATKVSNTDAKADPSPEPSLAPVMPPKVEDVVTMLEAPPSKPPQILKLGKNTEAILDDPVQRILMHREPPIPTDEKTRGALASSCCCQSLKIKIDQLEQLMQVQLSLIKKLVAQAT